jgi:hypothetical protein
MAEIINTGIICTGGDVTVTGVIGDNATITVNPEPDED